MWRLGSYAWRNSVNRQLFSSDARGRSPVRPPPEKVESPPFSTIILPFAVRNSIHTTVVNYQCTQPLPNLLQHLIGDENRCCAQSIPRKTRGGCCQSPQGMVAKIWCFLILTCGPSWAKTTGNGSRRCTYLRLRYGYRHKQWWWRGGPSTRLVLIIAKSNKYERTGKFLHFF